MRVQGWFLDRRASKPMYDQIEDLAKVFAHERVLPHDLVVIPLGDLGAALISWSADIQTDAPSPPDPEPIIKSRK